MKLTILLCCIISSLLHSYASNPPAPLVVDTAQVMWVENGYNDEFAQTIMVSFKNGENLKTVIVDQWDDGATFPLEFYVTDFVKGFYTTIVDKEYDTKFVLTVFNDSGYAKTEFVLHPKEITKTVTLGVQEVSVPKKGAATIYSTAGRMVWRGSSSEVEQALRGLPRGIYIVKSGRTTKKVSVNFIG